MRDEFAERIASALERQVEQHDEQVARTEQFRSENMEFRRQDNMRTEQANETMERQLAEALRVVEESKDINAKLLAVYESRQACDAIGQPSENPT